jgi:hypothetical protein
VREKDERERERERERKRESEFESGRECVCGPPLSADHREKLRGGKCKCKRVSE